MTSLGYLLMVFFMLLNYTTSNPIPQGLTEEEFRGFSIDDESSNSNKVDIFSGYAKIRRQGRNHNGRSISFTKPFTVKDPLEFASAGRTLQQEDKTGITKFPEMAPVFNLQEMLSAEAEKLKAKVEAASLMAAMAAEEAEEKVQQIAEEAMREAGATKVEVESLIEQTIDSAINEAQEVFEEAEEESSTEADFNSDEELSKMSENDDENVELEQTTMTSDTSVQPLDEIDLGSVQEV